MKKIHETDMSLSHLKIAHEQLTLSPHFVLNTLNSIAGQSILFSTDLFHQIGAFSNLMKQSYKNVEEPHFLSDEIEFLKNFLACLHRSKKKCFINLELKQNLPFELVEVPRLLLGTLMENILKYGVCNSKNEQPVFHVNLEESPGGEKILVCYTVNKIDLAKNLPRSGHGLSTLLKILKHKYGDKASLTYSSSNHEFSTFLIIYYGKN
ncbi:histidine kinase [Algoriphagus sp. AK58]|uniref:histidine kinase n=1 Tax=Algoriphagus sp. AK58 TaxID=1406877 RepID=UPI001650347F|nr:histidine kinase [Algoriphagus sp. AK58]